MGSDRPATVVVTDGEQRAALALVRSLGSAGCSVHVVSEKSHAMSRYSRHTTSSSEAPSPLKAPGGFVEHVAEVIRDRGATVLIPVSEAATLAVLDNAHRFSSVHLPVQAAEPFVSLCDKMEVLRVADELGIATPPRMAISTKEALPATIPFSTYPVVLKTSRSVSGNGGQRSKHTVSYVHDETALRTQLHALSPAAFPVMLQQLVPGIGVGVSMLLWDGVCRGVFAHRRLREKPPTGGVCVLGEAITPPPQLEELSLRLLHRFSWGGVAMVEYKVDPVDGTAYLMEVNPRPWGSLQLAIGSGVDFPKLLMDAMLGAPPATPPSYPAGTRMRWFWGDVDNLIAQLRGRGAAVDTDLLPWRSRVAALRAFIATRGVSVHETWTRGDSGPFIAETINWLRRVS